MMRFFSSGVVMFKDRQGVSARVWGWLQTSIVSYVSCTLILSCNISG